MTSAAPLAVKAATAALAEHLREIGLLREAAPIVNLAASRYAAETGVITAWSPKHPDDEPPF